MHTGSVLRLLANNAALQVRTKATVLKIQTPTGEGPADSEQPNLGARLQLLKEAVSQQRSQHRSTSDNTSIGAICSPEPLLASALMNALGSFMMTSSTSGILMTQTISV
ncbi:hypothetical protein BS47DRAFT_1035240 [Hydnum rufescens UP504]|uniref:Uncharacterized protein n=1 Tax=Hydnum rufescens UP504 TaxID=1448309 RepID=A0A9P6AVP2_9AGAM|nr:hypothetical protein BS47DRAFT_1035240 [Hydnum rufescens UP504]